MPLPLVRLSTQHGAVYVRPGHVLCIVPAADIVDDGGVRAQSIVYAMIPYVARTAPAGGLGQVWSSTTFEVTGAPDEVAAALWPAGARK